MVPVFLTWTAIQGISKCTANFDRLLLIQEKLVVVQANETQVVFVLCGELHNWECLNKWIYGQCHLFTKTNLFSTIFKA